MYRAHFWPVLNYLSQLHDHCHFMESGSDFYRPGLEGMRCHYEVLEIDRTADDDTVKKAYRKLALKWHPDKNPDKVEECTRYFALIQQAYDVLSDPHERAWYDRHRESILRGGFDEHYKDNSLNLFPYFTSSCYSGYGDDEKGFYAVYRHIFDTLASEDYEFLDGKIQGYPGFGCSDSDYDEVVGPFYAFWSSFCTIRSFAWVDKFDIRDAPNRRVVRAMEKENKKLRDASKRERNEEIRELTAFLRKRDPRAQEHKKALERKRLQQEKKAEEHRRQKILERLSQIGEYKESEEVRQSHLENLREIEEALDAEFGGGSDENEESEDDDDSDFYCVFCEKTFKTRKALGNHEKSKKHKDTVNLLKKHLQDDDARLLLAEETHNEVEDAVEEMACESTTCGKKSKRQKRRERKREAKEEFDSDGDYNAADGGVSACSSKNEINVLHTENADEDGKMDAKTDETNIFLKMSKELEKAPASSKARRRKEKQTGAESTTVQNTGPKAGACDRCGEVFESRSKLFAHLKESGHATLKVPAATAGMKIRTNKNRKK